MKARRSFALVSGFLLARALLLCATPASTIEQTVGLAPAVEGSSLLGDGAWTPLGGPLVEGGQVRGLAVDLAAPGTLYAAVYPAAAGGSTIYRSTDGAASWTPLYETQTHVHCLAAHGDQILAGAGDEWHSVPAVYASSDGGATWLIPSVFVEAGGILGSVSIDPVNSDVAIMGGAQGLSAGVVYGTPNGGADWELLFETSQGGCGPVLISPHDPDRMLAGCATGVYLSTDGGATWGVPFTLGGSAVSLIAHPADPQTFYAGTTYGPSYVYRSQDGGLTWDLVLPDAGGPLAFGPPGTVYTVSGMQVWASSQEGDPGTWSQVGELPSGASSLSIDTGVSPAALYAGLETGGVVRSADGGTTWQARNSGLTSVPTVADIDIDPQAPNRLFAATAGHSGEGRYGGWRSEDAGLTWAMVSDAEILTFDIRPDDSQVVLAGAAACESATILRSSDGGDAFAGVYTPDWFEPDCAGGGEEILAVAAAPSHPDTLYAAGTAYPQGSPLAGVVLHSQDGGLTWVEVLATLDASLRALAVDPLDDQVAFAGGGLAGAAIYRTLDGGDSWQQVFTNAMGLGSILVDSVNPDVVYAILEFNTLYKSTDGGDTWNPAGSNLPTWSPGSNALAIDPMDHNHLYLMAPDYIGESLDAGVTWSGSDAPLNQGMPLIWSPRVLVPDGGEPVQTLHAGLSGVWVHRRLRQGTGDRYVAPGGDDSWNNCADPAAPCQTVTYALGMANAGETLRVAGGTYVENLDVGKSVTIVGGYSGPPGWTRDLGAYETVLDGSANPAVPGVWDGVVIGLPNVLWDADAGLYRMYYTGVGGLSNWAIGLATSPDGVTWTRHPGNPVLVADDETWEGDLVEDPFVRAEGGAFKMWYGNQTSIGYATSPDGVAWTKHPAPVLDPNPNPLAWDSVAVGAPSVIKPGAQYIMAYQGLDDSGVWQIGLATSSDGTAWVRQGDPVLGPGDPGDFDESFVQRPDLAYAGGVYHLLYRGLPTFKIGVATSVDGSVWVRYAGNPVLPGGDPWESYRTLGAGHLTYGGQWKAWYAARATDTIYSIGLATSVDGYTWTPDSAHNPVLLPGTPGDVQGAPVVRVYSPEQVALDGLADRLEQLEAPDVVQPQPEQIQVVLDGLILTGGTYWSGGAVSVESGAATLQSVKVTGNHAFYDGGGVWVGPDSSLEVSTSEVLGNSALGLGGGMYNAGTADLSRSTFCGNQADYGGGLRNDGGVIDVLNCTFTANSAGSRGGAIDNDLGGSLDLLNSTLSGNSAALGGGTSIADGTARAWNTILAGDGGGECDGAWFDGANNLATDATCGLLFGQVSPQALRLGSLTGSPAYFPLGFGSAAIDAGTIYFCPDVDEPGNLRPQDGDGDGLPVCDVGAHEAPTAAVQRLFLPLAQRSYH